MLKQHKASDFFIGLLWNYGSIVFLALGGFIFSFLIILFYDSETLGIFNLAYAYYLVLSQVAVFGIHMSITKYISEYSYNIEKCKLIFASATRAAFGISIFFSLLVALFLWKADFIDSDLSQALMTTLPALIFFSQNKIILGFLNGLSKMRAYAVFQALRNIFISFSILVLALFNVRGNLIPICFFISEFFLFLVASIYLLKTRLFSINASWNWIYKHILFGFKILPANMVLELNTKIDVICLGLVLKNESLIGVYSFATLFTEGFYQIFVVVRRSVNPKITQLFQNNNQSNDFALIERKISKYLRIFGIPLLTSLTVGYVIICYLLGKNEYYQGAIPLFVISLSIVLNSKGIVFGNILSQLGFPTEESVINCVTATSNFLLNLIFIKYFGLLGAAIATAISYCIYTILLRKIVKTKLAYKL